MCRAGASAACFPLTRRHDGDGRCITNPPVEIKQWRPMIRINWTSLCPCLPRLVPGFSPAFGPHGYIPWPAVRRLYTFFKAHPCLSLSLSLLFSSSGISPPPPFSRIPFSITLRYFVSRNYLRQATRGRERRGEARLSERGGAH